jgi:hypothetical protein
MLGAASQDYGVWWQRAAAMSPFFLAMGAAMWVWLQPESHVVKAKEPWMR